MQPVSLPISRNRLMQSKMAEACVKVHQNRRACDSEKAIRKSDFPIQPLAGGIFAR